VGVFSEHSVLYNWLESFFTNRSHCTQTGRQLSDLLSITAILATAWLLVWTQHSF